MAHQTQQAPVSVAGSAGGLDSNLAVLAAGRTQALQSQIAMMAGEAHRKAEEAAFYAMHASRSHRQHLAAIFSDYNLGNLSPRLLEDCGFSTAVLNVYNTHQTRERIAKKHSGDASFIANNILHALANPYLYRRSLKDSDRLEIVGWANDGERALHIVLEPPAAVKPAQGSHG